jgi:hypothetical protein
MLWTYALCHPEINDLTPFPKTSKQYPRLLGVCQESTGCVVRSLHGDLGHYTFADFRLAHIAVPQCLLLSSFNANVLLISQEHTLDLFICSCNGPWQKDLLRSLVGVIAIDSVLAAKLIRDRELIHRRQIHNGPEEYYVDFLYSLSQNLREAICFPRPMIHIKRLRQILNGF